MLLRSLSLALCCTAWSVACSESERPPAADSDIADPEDTGARDTLVGDGSIGDASDAATMDGDAASVEPIAAVPGARCALAERVGLIVVQGSPTGTTPSFVSGVINDRPDPWYGQPALANEACAYHRYQVLCPTCAETETCAIDGTCQPYAQPLEGAALVLRTIDGSAQQTIAANPLGFLSAQVTLPGTAWSFALRVAGLEVTLGPTSLPAAVEGFSAKLAGTHEAPTAIDASWTPADDGSLLFTRIPINHHAGGPTFTECQVPLSTAALHIDEPMLTPLAVDTGLEFQGFEHAHFAAARTPLGCIELRVQSDEFLSLTY